MSSTAHPQSRPPGKAAAVSSGERAIGDKRAFKTEALTEVNGHILEAARDSISGDQEWEFFCECGRSDCHEHVELTLDAYVALHDSGDAVLADGHRLSQVERARRLSQEAEALLGQAEQQVKRAKKNLQGRVLVVDDSADFLRAAADLVKEAAEVRLVGIAFSGEEAIRLLPDLKPDLVVLDIHMSGMTGIETARIIRRDSPRTVVVLASLDTAGYEQAANSVGAAALIDKAEFRAPALDALWLNHQPQR